MVSPCRVYEVYVVYEDFSISLYLNRTKNPLEGFHQLSLPRPVLLDFPKTPSEIFELGQFTTKRYGRQKHHIDSRQSRDNSNKSFRNTTNEKNYIENEITSFRVGQKSEKPDLVIDSLAREGEDARRSYQAQTFQRLSVSFLL